MSLSGKLTWAKELGYYAFDEFLGVKAQRPQDAAFLLSRINGARSHGSGVVSRDEVVGAPFHHYQSGQSAIVYTVRDLVQGADITVIGVCPASGSSMFLAYTAPLRLAHLP
jgi:hypothetical protein